MTMTIEDKETEKTKASTSKQDNFSHREDERHMPKSQEGNSRDQNFLIADLRKMYV